MPCKDYPANVKLYRGEGEALKHKSFNNVPADPALPCGESSIDIKLKDGWRLSRGPAPAPTPAPPAPAPSGFAKT